MNTASIDLIVRVIELGASLGLITACSLLYRFFRGGIMEYSFLLFTTASILFSGGILIATLIELRILSVAPFDAIHLLLEIIFVILLLVGLLLLYQKWTRQHSVSMAREQRDVIYDR